MLAAGARRCSPQADARRARAWLQGLTIRRRDAELVAGRHRRAEDRRAALVRARCPAELLALADPYAPDAPLLALGLAELDQLRDYFGRLRDVRLEIGGAELAELGLEESPRVGEILVELRRRKLNGELDGRESELAAARELSCWQPLSPSARFAGTRRAVRGRLLDPRRRRQRGPYASLNLGRMTGDDPSASTRTGGGSVPRSAPTRSSSCSTGRCTRRSSTGPSRGAWRARRRPLDGRAAACPCWR